MLMLRWGVASGGENNDNANITHVSFAEPDGDEHVPIILITSKIRLGLARQS